MTIDGSPADVIDMFERTVLDGADVESSRPGEIVARFAGQAGPFSNRTREVGRFTDRTVTFDHIEGPFDSCRERFVVRGDGSTSTVVDDGTFTMRWGVAGWLYGMADVRPPFQRVVADELDRVAGHTRV